MILTVPPVAFAVKADALTEFAPVKLIPTVPAFKSAAAAVKAPAAVRPLAAWLAFNVNDVPELAFSVMLLLAISTIDTTPVELAVRLVAFVELAADNMIPPVPAARLAVAAFNAPPVVIPLAAWFAFKVNDVPELAFSVIAPALVFTIDTAPVELAVNVEAFKLLAAENVIPAVPAVKSAVAALRTPPAVMPLAT